MIKNYVTIALRSMWRQRGYTLLNVAGLAVGMCVCLLIGLYVHDELSFDRFHERADRLAAVAVATQAGEGNRILSTPYPLAAALEAGMPEVERAVRTAGGYAVPVLRPGTTLRSDRPVLLADPAFFELFDFPLLQGDPATVLSTPDGAVVTESLARAYFGDGEPIGQVLRFDRWGTVYEVTVRGVARDVPANSTIQFDLVAPLGLLPADSRREDGWNSFMYRVYVLLREGTPAEAFGPKATTLLHPHYARDEKPPVFFAVPLPDLYLSALLQPEGFKGQTRYLYVFGSVALFVLLIAAINYVNLVTAQATRRAREVGVRKVLGARRGQLVRQFLSESVLMSVAALVFGLMLTEVTLPAFNVLFEKQLALRLAEHGGALAGLSAFVLGVGILAGTYPALVLSGFQPVRALRGAAALRAGGGRWLRKSLVVVQFAISLFLLVGTAVIYRQLGYMQDKDLGFAVDQVVAINLPGSMAWEMRTALAEQARSHPGVVKASAAQNVPGDFAIRMGYPVTDVIPDAPPGREDFTFAPALVDYDFTETLGMRLLAGRPFSPHFPADEVNGYILNETAAARLGWTPAEAVGKTARFYGRDGPEGEVIGVVADFHLTSLRERIDPVLLHLRPAPSWSATGVLLAKLSPSDVRGAMAHLERVMARFAPGEPFSYSFVDDTFDAMYRTEERLSQVFTSFAVLALFIACLGLFGLAAYAAEIRTKEIGIRKVLGASVPGLVALLSKEFAALVAVAFVLAAPLAYLAMNRWLADFAYRIDLGPALFLGAGLAALALALLTVSYQALRAALADPVKALRYE